jgi:predicted small secreted protein
MFRVVIILLVLTPTLAEGGASCTTRKSGSVVITSCSNTRQGSSGFSTCRSYKSGSVVKTTCS